MTSCKLALRTALSFAAITAAFVPPAAAIEYPWCVQYNGDDAGGGRNCGFVSYEQCMLTARGGGASCERNQFYSEVAPPQTRKPRKRKPSG